MSQIRSLTLTNFRSYGAAMLETVPNGAVVLHGPNGAGKTNLLEALSYLSPGRGLRGAKIPELQRIGSDRALQPWAIAAGIEGRYGAVQLGTGGDAVTERRLVRVNGAPAKSQAALADYLSCLWLTPQMDRLFIESAGARRRFFDRLVYAFDPGHAARVSRYETALGARAKILRDQSKPDPAWLAALEVTMAEAGTAIAAARVDFIRRLGAAADGAADDVFPRADLTIAGTLEALLACGPALEAEEAFKAQLRRSRAQDAAMGGAATGPHRSDFSARYVAKDMPAAQCSTGEQKALLIGIVLAHARLVAAENGAAPLLLLDEVAAHLDEDRRAALFRLLLALGGQVWLTGTDAGLFAGLDAAFYEVREGRVRAAAQGRAA